MVRFRDPSLLELAFDRAVRDLKNYDIGSEEYERTLDRAIKLHKMLSEERSSYVSKDTMAVIAANLLGLIIIVKHEYANVISARAMNWLIKPFTRF